MSKLHTIRFCGCQVTTMSKQPSILFCALHAGAPKTLELLRGIAAFWECGTPVHPGSLLAGEILAHLREVAAEYREGLTSLPPSKPYPPKQS